MYNLSQKEVLEISDLISGEMVIIEKLGQYINQTNDPEFKRAFQDAQSLHLRHYDMLIRELQASQQFLGQQPWAATGVGATPYAGAQFGTAPAPGTTGYTGTAWTAPAYGTAQAGTAWGTTPGVTGTTGTATPAAGAEAGRAAAPRRQ